MKKWILLLCSLVAAVGATAQNDTLAQMKSVYIVGDKSHSELRLAVGGYQISFSGRETIPPKLTFSFGFKNAELGFSLLTAPDYGGYSDAQRGFLDLRTGKSIHFGFRIFDLGVALNKKRTIQLHVGLHLMCDNYTFSNNLTLDRVNGMIVPVALDRDYKKSKLTTAAFGIPVQMVFMPAKKLALSVLAYGDLVCNSHTKYKKPIEKNHLSGLADFQAGVGVSLSYHGIGVYGKYALTSLFREGVGPDTHQLTVGLYFGL